jgi:hypothetical protein
MQECLVKLSDSLSFRLKIDMIRDKIDSKLGHHPYEWPHLTAAIEM